MTIETSIYEYAKQGLQSGADRTAIRFYGRAISYGELFGKIDNVADHLYALGVREGTVVTIHLPNCPQAVMAIYAVAKLGGICNMVHALTPVEGVRNRLAFSNSNYLLTYLPACADAIPGALFVDVSAYMGPLYRAGFRLKNRKAELARSFDRFTKPCSEKARAPEQTALSERCVTYFHSSGTTGEPKTVMHCHRAINNSAENMVEYFGWYDFTREKVLSELPTFHGFGFVGNLHVVLRGGGQLFQMAKWDKRYASRMIDHDSITMMAGIPKVFTDLLSVRSFSGKSLKQCYVAGDSVPLKVKHDFCERIGKRCVYEAYGMTEIVAACCACNAEHNRAETSGYPINHCKMAVCFGGKVLSSGRGEIVVSTNTLMLGYLHANEPSASDHLLSSDGIQWFRTGDVGTIDSDGFLYCEGRIKDIIVHNGYNIFPKQIEKIALEVDGVTDACVVGITDSDNGTENVVAYIVCERDETLIGRQLEEKWRTLLPCYAIPSKIRIVKELPRNALGKIDKKRLVSMS